MCQISSSALHFAAEFSARISWVQHNDMKLVLQKNKRDGQMNTEKENIHLCSFVGVCFTLPAQYLLLYISPHPEGTDCVFVVRPHPAYYRQACPLQSEQRKYVAVSEAGVTEWGWTEVKQKSGGGWEEGLHGMDEICCNYCHRRCDCSVVLHHLQ